MYTTNQLLDAVYKGDCKFYHSFTMYAFKQVAFVQGELFGPAGEHGEFKKWCLVPLYFLEGALFTLVGFVETTFRVALYLVVKLVQLCIPKWQWYDRTIVEFSRIGCLASSNALSIYPHPLSELFVDYAAFRSQLQKMADSGELQRALDATVEGLQRV